MGNHSVEVGLEVGGDEEEVKIPFTLSGKYIRLPKFSDARKRCYNLSENKIQTKRPNRRVFCQNDANGIANTEEQISCVFHPNL